MANAPLPLTPVARGRRHVGTARTVLALGRIRRAGAGCFTQATELKLVCDPKHFVHTSNVSRIPLIMGNNYQSNKEMHLLLLEYLQ